MGAKKYDIPPIKLHAAAKYKAAMATLQHSQTFSENAHLIYSNTVESDKNLRNLVVQTTKDHIKSSACKARVCDSSERSQRPLPRCHQKNGWSGESYNGTSRYGRFMGSRCDAREEEEGEKEEKAFDGFGRFIGVLNIPLDTSCIRKQCSVNGWVRQFALS